MARPISLPKQVGEHRFVVTLPVATGSKNRRKATLPTYAVAMAYHAACLAALAAGEALPDVEPFRSAQNMPKPASSPVVAVPLADDFASVAAHWCHEYFVEGNGTGPDREKEVRRQIEIHILPYLEEIGVRTGSELTREQFKAFLIGYANPPHTHDSGMTSGPETEAGGPGERWFTTKQAVDYTGRSLATIKRRRGEGAFPRAHRVAGQWTIPGGDLVAAGLLDPNAGRRGRKTTDGYSQGTINDLRRILTNILNHGRETVGWTLQFDPAKVTKVQTHASPKPKTDPISLADTARLAASLHPVHQTVLWLCRILGLRISEAYGLRLRDVAVVDDRGIIHVRGQGGRWFLVKDGDRKVPRRQTLKTSQSGRALVVPRHLMVLIRIVITTFHTAEDGTIADLDTRLIPGLGVAGIGGQASFRRALRIAATEHGIDLGIDLDDPLPPTPHDLRKGIISDLGWTNLPDQIRKRFAGHEIGGDINSRIYLLDHPSRAPMLKAAEAVEALLNAEIPGGLIVPTTLRCTTGAQRALADPSRRRRGPAQRGTDGTGPRHRRRNGPDLVARRTPPRATHPRRSTRDARRDPRRRPRPARPPRDPTHPHEPRPGPRRRLPHPVLVGRPTWPAPRSRPRHHLRAQGHRTGPPGPQEPP
jgi:integrase